jgi:hypothetical protein
MPTMSRSGPTLHPPVLRQQADIDFVAKSFALVVEQRQREALPQIARGPADSLRIPIDSVSKEGNFDAYVHVGLAGGTAPNIKLLVDSGNSTLILPHFEAISQLENFNKDYHVELYGVKEPWGALANIVRGPIVLQRQGGTYTIPDCKFYACTGLNDDKKYTANFGIGCVNPWLAGDPHNLQSPLSYSPDYTLAQIDYAPADQVLTLGARPLVDSRSSITLCKAKPLSFPTMLQILSGVGWMSLRPESLDIGGKGTPWPGTRKATSIAMIDTGGGPVFLSDPENYLLNTAWPNAVPEKPPDWPGLPTNCEAISDDLVFSLSDGGQPIPFAILTKALPPVVQGLTLVMCENCPYMRNQDGMNIGGLTALFYSVLIDYKNAKVGFRSKVIAVA